MGTAPRIRRVSCPHCGRAAVYGPDNPFRPFCSERCRMVDLGHWADERYRVPAHEDGLDPASLAGPETDMLSSGG